MTTAFRTGKPGVTMDLSRSSDPSNIFAYFGAFTRGARHAGWTQEQIAEVIEAAKKGDYDHAVATICGACTDIEY